MPSRNFILFRTELFLHEQPDDQIDSWFVGGDCAGWFYARLLPTLNLRGETAPLMEDWGWYASVKTIDTNTSIAMLFYPWDYYDHCWLIGIDPRRRWLRRQSDDIIGAAQDCVADSIETIITSDVRFQSFGWHEQNPFDSGVKDPRTGR